MDTRARGVCCVRALFSSSPPLSLCVFFSLSVCVCAFKLHQSLIMVIILPVNWFFIECYCWFFFILRVPLSLSVFTFSSSAFAMAFGPCAVALFNLLPLHVYINLIYLFLMRAQFTFYSPIGFTIDTQPYKAPKFHTIIGRFDLNILFFIVFHANDDFCIWFSLDNN